MIKIVKNILLLNCSRLRNLIFMFTITLLVSYSCAFAYENAVYIWQRDWDKEVEASIKAIQPKVNHFIVLGGDFKYNDGKIFINPVDIHWSALSQKNAQITLVFRMNTGTGELLRAGKTELIAERIKNALEINVASAQKQHISISGFQFDYDCPTSKLADYAGFLQSIKQQLPGYELSITALPTWLKSPDFKDLIGKTSYYVLQLHSFEIPRTIDQMKGIFLKENAIEYLQSGSRLNHPFQISLPTYGYEIAFNETGKFLGLRAGASPAARGSKVQYITKMTSPDEILVFLKKLKGINLKNFNGICWFRLPKDSDEFNWDIQTLKAMLEERRPQLKITTEVTHAKDGLIEVYIINQGEQNLIRPVNIELIWADSRDLFYDVLGDFHEIPVNNGRGMRVEGPAPKVGEKKLIAWLRNIHDPHNPSITVGNVHIE